MVKINRQKAIQKPRTEDEMRHALRNVSTGQEQDTDDTAIVLSDCIEELLLARQLIEDTKAFAQLVTIKTKR